MNYTPLVQKASDFAIQAHDGQKDDEGLDYYVAHLLSVATIIDNLEHDEEMTAVAFLHDTLEDTDTTYYELEREFGKSIADMVNELTHDGEKDSYGYYFPRLKSQKAIIIKFADRLSNLSRMNAWDEERRRQYIAKSKFWKDGSNICKGCGRVNCTTEFCDIEEQRRL
jgi:(p)ppGpp synthase/HD superfamily hydrolase